MDAGDDIESQTTGTLSKIDDLLAAANSSKSDLVKVTILMTDIEDYGTINQIYGEWLEIRYLLPELHIASQNCHLGH